jgi:hypothetical protein
MLADIIEAATSARPIALRIRDMDLLLPDVRPPHL